MLLGRDIANYAGYQYNRNDIHFRLSPQPGRKAEDTRAVSLETKGPDRFYADDFSRAGSGQLPPSFASGSMDQAFGGD